MQQKSKKKKSKKDDSFKSDDSDTAFNSDDDFDEDKNDNNNLNKYNFPEFEESIKNAFNDFNDKIFIKLNWSSPQDAYWCLNKLSCENLSDVYMLLRSSDFITHDLTEPFDKCDESTEDEKNEAMKSLKYYLIVRKWTQISPSGEFRCFVKNDKLVGKFKLFNFSFFFLKSVIEGISQRDIRTFYKFIHEKKEKIIQLIKDFYNNHINQKFFTNSFVFDVYIKKNVIIILSIY